MACEICDSEYHGEPECPANEDLEEICLDCRGVTCAGGDNCPANEEM